MSVFVFPGQGSQHRGMGEGLFDAFPHLVAQADDCLGYSIQTLCLEDPDKQLLQTQYTQPALYVVNALTYLKHLSENPVLPSAVAGHSLGEYNALLAAGVFDFITGLKLVQQRGQLMSQADPGAMAAIIGLSIDAIRKVLEENQLNSIDVANENAPSQTVISGPKDILSQSLSLFEAAGAQAAIPLNVSSAFHSRYMEPAKQAFSEFLELFDFKAPATPVISNVTAKPYSDKDTKHLLAQQITKSVRWTETVQHLLQLGHSEFQEMGPGQVLTGLITKIKNASPQTAVPSNLPQETTEIAAPSGFSEKTLGAASFREAYGSKYSYVAGGMYKGVASKELVIRMGQAQLLSFLGTGGLSLERIENDIQAIQEKLSHGEPYGVNLLCNLVDPEMEAQTVELYLKYGIQFIEAAAYMQMTAPLVLFRARGLSEVNGQLQIKHRVIAKISRPEVAESFLQPAPDKLIEQLLLHQQITAEQARLAQQVPMADDICVEADSAGHTDRGVAYTLMPAMLKLREAAIEKYGYQHPIHVGAAGGIGTPEAAAAAIMLGADFLVTGSINQCTVESGASNTVKDLLQTANVQDTAMAPAGDMFEIGAKVQVFRKGVLFPARGNKLYELYQTHRSLDELDERNRQQLEERFFHKTLAHVWQEVCDYYQKKRPQELERAERNPKHKMALVFRWYFAHTNRLALEGDPDKVVDYQIHCGPALGAFNQWVKGSELESWKARHVDEIGTKLMKATADLMNRRFSGK